MGNTISRLQVRSPRRAFATAVVIVVATITAFIGAAPASADEPVDTHQAVLDQFRANLVAVGDTAGVATFDAFTEAQRSDLSAYLLGESVSFDAPPAEAQQVGNGDFVYGDFQWAAPSGAQTASAEARQLSTQGYNIPVWGTQSFSFAGISIIEVKNSMTYTVDFSSSRGNYISNIPAYSCAVTHNYDILADVTSTKENAFTSGDWEVESQCKVRITRGVPTPWGQVTWSTKEAIHYLHADNTGWVMANGWE